MNRSHVLLGSSPVVLAVAVLAALYGWAVFVSTFAHPGAIGLNYNTPGSDWMALYAAARASLAGHTAILFDGDRFTAHLNAVFAARLSEPLQFRPWVYPPSFLLILAPFSRLGFVASYAAFQLVTAGLLVAALRHRADHAGAASWIALATLVSPAAAINVVDGQCSFLVAALVVGAFRTAPARPLVAGLLLGLLTFKPQFGLLVPVALLARRDWRTALGAAVTTLVLVVVSALVFGPDAWTGWARETLSGYLGGNPKWVTLGRLWGDSVYACAVALGASAATASAIQTAVILLAALATYRIFRSRLPPDLKLAALLTAMLLAAPHSATYDKVLLIIALGLWLAHVTHLARPLPPGAGIIALALWLSPLLGPPIVFWFARLTPALLVAFMLLLLRTSDQPAGASSAPAASTPSASG